MVINIAVALWLFPSFGARGIAVASAVAGWINAAMLFASPLRTRALGQRYAIVDAHSAAGSGGGSYGGRALVWRRMGRDAASNSPVWTQTATLAALCAGGAIVYFAVAFGTGGASLAMLRRNVRRGAGVTGQHLNHLLNDAHAASITRALF